MFFDKIFDVQNFTEITGLNDELKSIYVYNYYTKKIIGANDVQK